MAEVENSAYIGDHAVRMSGWDDPTEEGTQYEKLKNWDPNNGGAALHRLVKYPASFYVENLYILTAVAAAGTGDSCRRQAPWPFTIWSADVGCESAAGATGTIDLYTDDGTTDASILDAAEDVKAAAGQGQTVAPEAGSEEVAYGTEFYIQGASGAGGTLVGGQAHLVCQRL